MSVYTNQQEADAATIASLLRELKRRPLMSTYFRNSEGQLCRTDHFEVVDEAELRNEVAELRSAADELEVFLPKEGVAEQAVADPVQPAEAPAVDQPAPEAAPVVAEAVPAPTVIQDVAQPEAVAVPVIQ